MSFSVTSRRRGSSPLTRGKHVTDVTRARRCGLIPAHAGKTRGWSVVPQASGAHPRSRGENGPEKGPRTLGCGSSPLTRGKLHVWGAGGGRRGLIPAHAGKTRPRPRASGVSWAHPRSRGENQGDRIFDRSNNGSSPLTRGKPERRRRRQQRDRLIPAHAGKTCVRLSISLRNRAHPRSRGENGRVRHRHVKGRGSSPLTRGKPHGIDRRHCAVGLIPAHAGKTARRAGMGADGGAHPRSRGENPTSAEPTPSHQLAHPRSRGENWIAFDGAERSEAHPRSRGENDLAVNGNFDGNGSSPLTRGKPALSS